MLGTQQDQGLASSFVKFLCFKRAGGPDGCNFIFFFALHFGLFVLSTLADVEICFPTKGIYKNFYPPRIPPPDQELVYTVSVNQRMSRPVIAQLCENNTPIGMNHPDYSHPSRPRQFLIESLDWKVAGNQSGAEDPLGDQLVLCQYASNNFPIHDPRRYDTNPIYSKKTCTETNSLCITYYKNLLVAQGLYHEIRAAYPSTTLRRVLRFIYMRSDNILIHKDTEVIGVRTDAALGLQWSEPPPQNVVTNKPFDMKLSIVDKQNKIVTTGLDSTLFVEVTVEYTNKYFTIHTRVDGFLYFTKMMMDGDEVRTSVRNQDKILRKRAVNGVVEFKGVRLLDVSSVVFLNATLIVPRTHVRQPDDYSDVIFGTSLGCYRLVSAIQVDDPAEAGLQLMTFTPDYSIKCKCRAVSLSDVISVRKQTASNVIILQRKLQPEQKHMYNVTAFFTVPDIWVKIVDDNGDTVHSGPDAELLIEVTTDPKGLALSNDSNFKTYRGQGKFHGAVCNVTDNVKLVFKTTTANGTTLQNITSSFRTTSDIQIAFFAPLTLAGRLKEAGPNVETFARLAVEDVNNGFYDDKETGEPAFQNLKGKAIVLQSFDTETDYHTTIRTFDKVLSEQDDPSQMIKSVIGFGSEELLKELQPFINVYNVPIITTSSADESLSTAIGGDTYQNVVPICWNSISVAVNLALMLNYRRWNRIIVIQCDMYPIPRALFRKWHIFNINVKMVRIASIPKEKWNMIEELPLWKEVKSFGTKIIFHYVPPPLQIYLYNQAIKFNYSSAHGYQWITVEEPARAFPYTYSNNSTCYEGMEGMIHIIGEYDNKGLASDPWFYANQRYFGMDRDLYHGTPTTRRLTEFGDIALGYDAVLVFAHAFNQLFNSTNEAIDTYSISNKLTKKNVEGLTGTIHFGDGRRIGYLAVMNIVNRTDDGFCVEPMRAVFTSEELEMFVVDNHEAILQWTTAKELKNDKMIRQKIGLLHTNPKSNNLFETLQLKSWQTEVVIEPPKPKKIKPLVLPNTSTPSVRYYLSKRHNIRAGKLNLFVPDDVVLRTEFIVTPYNCPVYGCGNRTSALEYKQFNRGTCTGVNECRCKLVREIDPSLYPEELHNHSAYYGHNCQNIACVDCDRGECFTPFKCTCNAGWKTDNTADVQCTKPICDNVKCIHGTCIAPDQCECYIGYHGASCNVLLGVIVLVALLLLLILCIVFFAYFHWRRRRKKKKYESANLDWLVRWKDVTENSAYRDIHAFSPEALSRGSGSDGITQTEAKLVPSEDKPLAIANAARSKSMEVGIRSGSYCSFIEWAHLNKMSTRYVEWKDQECFVQKFDRPSLDIEDMDVRKEVQQLKELKHPNLISFIGVCVEWPHVGILVEIMPKGSLDQIISNTNFSLTWSFKFSILRDICHGMEYLHNSKIVSHGRLKSPNCLIDNRWTCKVSGFAIPTFRSKSYAVYELETMRRQLLWTAPELLRIHSNPSEIGKGTKPGDIYSFGIILTELCCHKKPWDAELAIISLEELIRILKDVTHPANRGIKRLLETHNYDTSKPLRPALTPTFMPETYIERKSLKRVIDELTSEDPIRRPYFKEIAALLNAIHPLKGELVENLIDMLENYTNHLEDMLAGKMQEIQSEKKKTEDVIARLLPASIAEKLKLNQVVEPQKHDDVTIFFSDIKGFTAIANASTPMQVVELLNELYTLFDSIIDSYDAYKLETIGDAYCVVSGIPTPNPHHAIDVTSMALDISGAVDNFPIRHLPGRSLECRIGVNSGSVVAGVLGVKMPRYSIFGIDVVTASQMEANGECKRVHISENTAKLLVDCDLFVLQYRGEMILKSVGAMKTYFVYRKGSRLDPTRSSTEISHSRRGSAELQSEDMKKRMGIASGQARFSVMGQKRKLSSREEHIKEEARILDQEPSSSSSSSTF